MRRCTCLILLFSVPALYCVALSADKTLSVEWSFTGDKPLIYRIIQNMDAQVQHYNEEMDDWSKKPIHREALEGKCTLKPLGDGNGQGELLLRMLQVVENDQYIPLPPEQSLAQKVSEFIITPKGDFESYEGGDKETYLLVRLIFGLPVKPLEENVIRTFPFRFYTSKQTDVSDLEGTITHELAGFETINERYCAKITSTVDLSTSSKSHAIPDKIYWKGTGVSYFDFQRSRLEKATWRIAKKTETKSGEPKMPTKLIEIFNLDIQFMSLLSK